jgi:peptidoglycan/LPS O-acetylase OafA/YrhL
MAIPNLPHEIREPVLDGVRGVAIAAVLWHHFVICSGFAPSVLFDQVVWETGSLGWVGVDLFFVLSGFLITGILYDSRSSGRYYVNFFGRRALRILPLYYVVLAITFLILPAFLDHQSADWLTRDQAWFWSYLVNFKIATEVGANPVHLGHFWSLAIEEQFYLIWPFVVRMLSWRRLLILCIVCFFAALLLRLVVSLWISPLAAYVLMPTRMDSLAAGAALALVARGAGGLRSMGRWPIVTLAFSLSVLVLLYAVHFVHNIDSLISNVQHSLLAATFAALIAMALLSARGSVLRLVLGSVPLVVLGKYSYALYVFHAPIVVLMRDFGFQVHLVPSVFGSQWPGLAVFSATAAALSFACALLSWRFLEAPMLRLTRYFRTSGRPQPSAGKTAAGESEVEARLTQGREGARVRRDDRTF